MTILGRCIPCVASKRTAEYCRQVRGHTAPKAMPCIECTVSSTTLTKCRVQLKHTGINGKEHISFDQPVQYGFSECCTELCSFTLEVPVKTSLENVAECCKYGRGYTVPYSKQCWMQWYTKYQAQTNATFVTEERQAKE